MTPHESAMFSKSCKSTWSLLKLIDRGLLIGIVTDLGDQAIAWAAQQGLGLQVSTEADICKSLRSNRLLFLWDIVVFLFFCKRSQGSNPGSAQMGTHAVLCRGSSCIGAPFLRLQHFPLDCIPFLRYTKCRHCTHRSCERYDGSAASPSQLCLALSLSPAGLGTDPALGASLFTHCAAEPGPDARTRRSAGGPTPPALDHVPSATVVGYSVQEASPSLAVCPPPQSGRATGACGTPSHDIATDGGARSQT